MYDEIERLMRLKNPSPEELKQLEKLSAEAELAEMDAGFTTASEREPGP